jgi:hypothetical protein
MQGRLLLGLDLVVEHTLYDLLLLNQERPDDPLAHAMAAPARVQGVPGLAFGVWG